MCPIQGLKEAHEPHHVEPFGQGADDEDLMLLQASAPIRHRRSGSARHDRPTIARSTLSAQVTMELTATTTATVNNRVSNNATTCGSF